VRQLIVQRGQGGKKETRLGNRLERGCPVLHKVATAHKDDFRRGVAEGLFAGVVGQDLALHQNTQISI